MFGFPPPPVLAPPWLQQEFDLAVQCIVNNKSHPDVLANIPCLAKEDGRNGIHIIIRPNKPPLVKVIVEKI